MSFRFEKLNVWQDARSLLYQQVHLAPLGHANVDPLVYLKICDL